MTPQEIDQAMLQVIFSKPQDQWTKAEAEIVAAIQNQGKNMTNRERAEKIDMLYTGSHPRRADEIERALDEAEKRGARNQSTSFRNLDELAKASFVEGQREIRERAATFLKNNGDYLAAEAIRALPIDGG